MELGFSGDIVSGKINKKTTKLSIHIKAKSMV